MVRGNRPKKKLEDVIRDAGNLHRARYKDDQTPEFGVVVASKSVIYHFKVRIQRDYIEMGDGDSKIELANCCVIRSEECRLYSPQNQAISLGETILTIEEEKLDNYYFYTI